MAERRMFAKSIIDSDAFLTMPSSTQALYFHLCMRADDDGFVNSPRSIQKMVGANDDDFKLLLVKRFILPFDSGIIVIKHWRIHNYIQTDRYVETKYLEEKSLLGIKDNKAYTFIAESDECVPLPVGESKAKKKDVLHLEAPEEMTNEQQGQVVVDVNDDLEFLNSIAEPEPRKPRNELAKVLDDFGISGELREVFKDFIDMRKKKKRPLTPRALKMVINRLGEFAKDDNAKIDLLNEAILHSWDTVYAHEKTGANGIKIAEKKDHTLDDIF